MISQNFFKLLLLKFFVKNNMSSLHMAVEKEDIEMVKFLLAFKNINVDLVSILYILFFK